MDSLRSADDRIEAPSGVRGCDGRRLLRRSGDGVQINTPSEANMRANKNPILGPGNGWRFLNKMLD